MSDEIAIQFSAAAPSPTDLDPRVLDHLIALTRTPDGCAAVSSAGVLAAVLRRLSSTPTPLLFRSLVLLRNLLAAPETLSLPLFLSAGGADRIASALLRAPPVPPEVVRAALHVVGTLAQGGEVYRAAVWGRFFPVWFGEMALVGTAAVNDPLCWVIDSCCAGEAGRGRIGELREEGRGMVIVGAIVSTGCHVGYHEDWLECLLSKICVEESNFPTLFLRLGTNNSARDVGRCNFSPEQAFLLRTLEKFIANRPQDVGRISRDFALGVLRVFKEMSAIVDKATRTKATLPADLLALDILGFSLNILKHICTLESSHPQIVEAPINWLLSAGLLDVVLGLLHELEPPSMVKKSPANTEGQVVQSSFGTKVCPYKGYRRDLVSVIANCVHRRREVQDEIRKKGAIQLLFHQCVIDEENPFLREWGLMAVRNLLEGNLENQNEVAEMELNTPQIAGLGSKVEIDEKSHRPKPVNIK